MSTRTGGYGIVLSIVIIITLSAFQPAGATQFSGGNGLTVVQFPTCLPPGSLNMKMFTRAYVKNLDAYTITNGTGVLAANFGFTKHFELGFTQIMYQDLNLSAININNLEQVPDDFYLRAKIGNYPFTIGNAYFKFGVLNQLRYRTGKVDNVVLEPYSGNGIEWEMDLLLSYYSNPMYEDYAPSFHLNMGYLNHNDAGLDVSAFKATQEFVYGAAFVYPTRFFDFWLEQHGAFFTTKPKEWAFSRENNIWITPGVKYKMFYGLNISLACDLLIYDEEESTVPLTNNIKNQLEDYPNYPEWRLNGIISFNPSTTFFRQPTFGQASDPQSIRKLLRDRKSLFEWVVDEQEGLEYIDIELEKIKAERKKAEEDLEKLKGELQQSGQTQKP